MTVETRREYAEIVELLDLYEKNGAVSESSADGTALLLWQGKGQPEVRVEGRDLIDLLMMLKGRLQADISAVRHTLDAHKVPGPDGLSQADRINLLVGRRSF